MDTPRSTAEAVSRPDDPTIWRVDDALWALLAPILARDKVRKKPGRPRHDDRPIFDGLIWLARTGSQWTALPREFGPKSTVHERFREWVADGNLERAWAVLLAAYDTPHIPPKASAERSLPAPDDPDRHPPRRWVVEVGLGWFNRFRRLLIRWDKQGEHYLGFVQVAAVLIIYRTIRHARSRSG